jgi:transcriptional regulator with XRE-family HTH domain
MRAIDVAREMGLAPRSYQHFEAGRGRLDIVRLERFAEATDSDPYAIVIALALKRPDFALNAMDNKLCVINLFALDDFNSDLGEDIRLIEPQVLGGAFQRVVQDLTDYVRKRDLTVERWLEDRSRKAGLPFLPFSRRRKDH